jgi:predicted RNA binding protein YcfA (HicA-like mRNA interferase family)
MDKVGRVSSRRFEKFLLKVGCEYVSQESSHRKYRKPGLARPIIVPFTNELPAFIILNNLRTLGIPKKVYIEIISRLK